MVRILVAATEGWPAVALVGVAIFRCCLGGRSERAGVIAAAGCGIVVQCPRLIAGFHGGRAADAEQGHGCECGDAKERQPAKSFRVVHQIQDTVLN